MPVIQLDNLERVLSPLHLEVGLGPTKVNEKKRNETKRKALVKYDMSFPGGYCYYNSSCSNCLRCSKISVYDRILLESKNRYSKFRSLDTELEMCRRFSVRRVGNKKRSNSELFNYPSRIRGFIPSSSKDYINKVKCKSKKRNKVLYNLKMRDKELTKSDKKSLSIAVKRTRRRVSKYKYEDPMGLNVPRVLLFLATSLRKAVFSKKVSLDSIFQSYKQDNDKISSLMVPIKRFHGSKRRKRKRLMLKNEERRYEITAAGKMLLRNNSSESESIQSVLTQQQSMHNTPNFFDRHPSTSSITHVRRNNDGEGLLHINRLGSVSASTESYSPSELALRNLLEFDHTPTTERHRNSRIRTFMSNFFSSSSPSSSCSDSDDD